MEAIAGHGPKIESVCAVGDPMLVEWKGNKYYTVYRGSRPDSYVLAEIQTSTKAPTLQIDEPGFVLVDIPVVDGKPMLFEFNAVFVVRFLSGGVVYSFRTSFVRVHTKPSVIVLEYPPRALERHNLRTAERMELMAPVKVSVDGGGVEGAVVDISSEGAMLLFEKGAEFSIGTVLAATFTLPDGMPVEGLSVTVRNRRSDNGHIYYGVHFSAAASKELLAVKSYYSEYIGFAEASV